MSFRLAVATVALLGLAPAVRAGLYYSGETMADLPSQWRGFLLDHRALRGIGVKPAAGSVASPLRTDYEEAAAKLEKAARAGKITADELADLGALYVRLGEPGKAVELLRKAQRDYPEHFRIVSNLGTAWQLQGELDQAALCLQQAIKLAPGKWQKAEEAQLKLIRDRKARGRDSQELDDLFDIRYVNDKGEYEPGKLSEEQRKKLPAGAAAVVQQLALWMPADGRLLWQLGELANQYGDPKAAAQIMDGCVTEFGMASPELRRHRQLSRAAADAQGDASPPHEGHTGLAKMRSRRPLRSHVNLDDLPPITADGTNPVPWPLLSETTLERGFKPTFPKYLKDLDGKQVALSGFMQPLDDGADVNSFMLIEAPVGCWYCEVPEMTGMVYIELPANKTIKLTRGLIKITGQLKLNATDPESFLFTINKAKVAEAD